jgi:hypothetical protein
MVLNVQKENDSSWITPCRFVLLLATLTFVSWPGVFLGLEMFAFRDFGFFALPIAWHLRESFWHMEWPLWNPLNNCGQPFLAEWNTQALYPPALFYLVLPFPWSLGVFCLLHLFLGGLGMFFLARHWTQNSFAAAVAGVIFAFGALTLSSLLWPATIAGLGWMPWVVWLTQRAWNEGGRTLIFAVIVGALQMLSGGVEPVLMAWVLLGVMALSEFISGSSPRVKICLRFALIVLLVSGLSAAQLLPFIDFLNHSERQGNYYASDSPMPPTGWVNFFVPLFRYETAQGIYFQHGQYWILSYYTGIITMVLAVLAICRYRQVRVWILGILTLFSLVLAMGNATPVYGWLCSHAGIFGLVRFPIKFVILPAFALPLMAACGLVKREPPVPNQKPARSGCLWLVLWLAVIGLISGCLAWTFYGEPSHAFNHVVFVNELVRILFFTAILAGLFFLKKIVSPKLCRWLQLLVLVLIWLDLDTQAPHPATVNSRLFQPNMSRPLPAPQLGVSRAMIPFEVLNTLTFAAHQDVAENFLSDRFALFSDCNLLDDIPKCDGFFPVNLKENAFLSGNLNEPMQDFLGVSEVLAIQGKNLEWTPRSTFTPLLTGGQKPIFADDATTLEDLSGTNFDPRAEVILPLECLGLTSVSNTATVKISSEKFSAQEIDAEVTASANTMLVAAQSYYHPWHAYVDGQPTPLWRANYAFQALEIPAGTHQISLIYLDRNFRLGLTLSLITLTGILVFYCVCPARQKN